MIQQGRTGFLRGWPLGTFPSPFYWSGIGAVQVSTDIVEEVRI